MQRPQRLPRSCADATKIILPGVGAFDHAMARLNSSGMRATLDELVLGAARSRAGRLRRDADARPIERRGAPAGLGWLPGHVAHIGSLNPASDTAHPPHGLERRSTDVREQALCRSRVGGTLLFPAFVLLSLRPARRRDRAIRLRRDVQQRRRGWQHLRRAVPSRKEPPLRDAAPEELRGALTCCGRESSLACSCGTGAWSRRFDSRTASTSATRSTPSRIFNEKEVDELIVLDIDATSTRRRAQLQADRSARRRMPNAAVLRRRRQDGRAGEAHHRAGRREGRDQLGGDRTAAAHHLDRPRRSATRASSSCWTSGSADSDRATRSGLTTPPGTPGGPWPSSRRKPSRSAPARSSSTRSTTTA